MPVVQNYSSGYIWSVCACACVWINSQGNPVKRIGHSPVSDKDLPLETGFGFGTLRFVPHLCVQE